MRQRIVSRTEARAELDQALLRLRLASPYGAKRMVNHGIALERGTLHPWYGGAGQGVSGGDPSALPKKAGITTWDPGLLDFMRRLTLSRLLPTR